MPLWNSETPPKFLEKIGRQGVATDRGWEDAKSKQKEVIASISSLATKANEANILSVQFDKLSYEQGDEIAIIVRYNERVNVTAGAALIISSSGLLGDVTAYAAAQTGVSEVVFSRDVALDPLTIPLEEADLSIAAQNIVGVILDSNDNTTASELEIKLAIASAAGVRNISA